jgi:hypothetical protein
MARNRRSDLHVIFLHIPKAAGTTLKGILDSYYKKQDIFEIDGSRRLETIAQFTSLPLERRAEIMLLRGHMPFGLHEYLPQPRTYITMFRNPAARVVSIYHFARQRPHHYLYNAINGKNLDIESFVSTGITPETDNQQVRFLTGHIDDIEVGACTSRMLEQAKKNLTEHFAVVGLQERFDESLLLIKKRLGWNRLPLYQSRNVGTHKRPELPERVLKTIRKHNELDYELFEWASDRFQRQFEQENIQKELERFRRANSVYRSYKSNSIYRSYKKLRAMAGRLRAGYRAAAK